MVKKLLLPLAILLVIFVIALAITTLFFSTSSLNSESNMTSAPTSTPGATNTEPPEDAPMFAVVAENLDTPWALVFLPDQSILVTERPGRVRFVKNDGTLQEQPIATLENVREIGEGGLLGITLHPNFSSNNYVYLYYTYAESGGQTLNRVVRMTYENGQLQDEEIIVDEIPGAPNHNGGRIKFGPDNFLYITTGDAQNPSLAQNTKSLAGKILRVADSGDPASGNPFGNAVYSYGHRNPQGLAWDENGNLWSTEHGRSGVLSGLDELNLIERGRNYGWQIIQGDETRTGMETPKLHSGNDTWAPAGAAFVNNSLFFAGLRGQTLYEAVITNDEKISLNEHFKTDFGRLREVILGPDNLLYITTSNRDGRGNPIIDDDKIIRVNPSKL
ncbi:MAG: hypothetical protein ACD_50C00019G0003 [uncultured bacterium]|nr:MAG: hypothetical protein ACD_50C00019G0003 [uncultured bacterium]